MHDCSYFYEYNLLGDLIKASDAVNGISLERNVDFQGNILSEKLSTGLSVEKTYDALGRPLSLTLPDRGKVFYTYDPLFLRSISRTDSMGNILYNHRYTSYDTAGFLNEESLLNDLGIIKHAIDAKGRKIAISSPYFSQSCRYDEADNVVAMTTNGKKVDYAYDGLDQLSREGGEVYVHDSNYNRIEENSTAWTSNELDELLSTGEIHCSYDLNGNLISKKTPIETFVYAYDPLDRLVQVVSNDSKVEFAYDPVGRKVTKSVQTEANSKKEFEHYLYDGDDEIGAFTAEGTSKQLRVLGYTYNNKAPLTIAVELSGKIFAPMQDLQGNIRCLVDSSTKKRIAEYDFTAFGRHKKTSDGIFNPWRYASKRLDMETGLIDFGKRIYDSQLSRWLTTDPAGFVDNLNLYSYVRNNPLRYIDLKGNFAIPLIFIPLIEITFEGILSWLTFETAVAATTVAVASVIVYQIDSSLDTDDNKDVALENDPVAEATSDKDTEIKKWRKRFGKFKFPANPDDLLPELPRDRKGRIYPADNIRIRPEKHDLKPGEIYNSRHHGQHYHVDSRRDPQGKWKDYGNIEKQKPPGYVDGQSTGFLPGEYYPGVQ